VCVKGLQEEDVGDESEWEYMNRFLFRWRYVCVCMYVYMYVCVPVGVYIYVHICAKVNLHMCVIRFTYVC
jgi:hypothetical protein